MKSQVFGLAIVFLAIYYIIKLITDFLLKRRMIKENMVDKTQSVIHLSSGNAGSNNYPTLKWGLVALFAGIGFILIELIHLSPRINIDMYESFLSLGILLVSVALGFLLYFFIVKEK